MGWAGLGAAFHLFIPQVISECCLGAQHRRLPGEQTWSLSVWTRDLVQQTDTNRSITQAMPNRSSSGCHVGEVLRTVTCSCGDLRPSRGHCIPCVTSPSVAETQLEWVTQLPPNGMGTNPSMLPTGQGAPRLGFLILLGTSKIEEITQVPV